MKNQKTKELLIASVIAAAITGAVISYNLGHNNGRNTAKSNQKYGVDLTSFIPKPIQSSLFESYVKESIRRYGTSISESANYGQGAFICGPCRCTSMDAFRGNLIEEVGILPMHQPTKPESNLTHRMEIKISYKPNK